VLDVRLYELVPGAGGEFDRLFSDHALPMLRRHGIEVVAYGRSRKDPDRYCLVRRFASEAERDESLAAFYGSPEWLENYDERVTALIASYSTAVIEDMASSQSG
jgi:hypothetical protein